MGIQGRIILLPLIPGFGGLLIGPELPEISCEDSLEIGGRSPCPAGFEIIKVPQQHMNECCGESHVGCNKVSQIRGSKPRGAYSCHFDRVHFEGFVENACLVVDNIIRAVRSTIEKLLGQEWEVLCIEDIAIVEAHEENDASQVSNEIVSQCVQWDPQRRTKWRNIVPVERKGN